METSNLQYQAKATHSLEEVMACSKPQQQQQQQQQERRLKPQPEQALRCPRCDSTNTKFCYYNNYSLTQPRYFCKGCRRYWTKGGSLRNVPVGGGCRKNKRSSSKKTQDQALTTNSNSLLPALPPPPPPLTYDPNDLTLAFARLQKPPITRQLGLDDHDTFMLGNLCPNPIPPQGPGFLDILRTGFLDTNTNALSNLYYGYGGNGNLEVEAGGISGVGVEEVVLPATIKQESSSCQINMDGDNKLFMGLQWQIGGDGNMMVNSGRDYWNGTVGSSWHGLVNSSLM